MSNNTSEQKKVTTESEIGSNGVGHSMHGSSGEGASTSSPSELELVLEQQAATIKALSEELAKAKAAAEAPKEDSSIDKLANALISAINSNNKAVGPTEPDNINRSTDYSKVQKIDGISMMESQATLLLYKSEAKEPISVPKTFQSQFGPTLPISVNGVRVSIPCDGRTYYINKTHAEAARERIAKVDRLLTNEEPTVIETNA